MTTNLRILSALGTVGAGAGVSTPLTVVYLKRDGVSSVFLVNGENREAVELIRNKRSLQPSGGDASSLKNLFKTWKKKFKEEMDEGSAGLIHVIDREFNKHSDVQKEERKQISEGILDTKKGLWKILDFQDFLFKTREDEILKRFENLRVSIEGIKDAQSDVINRQKDLVVGRLSEKIQKLKALLGRVRSGRTFESSELGE